MKGHKLQSLKDKNAVVTGGSKGIGKSVCLALANAGANIFILDINKEEGLKYQDLSQQIQFFWGKIDKNSMWL